MSASSRDGSFCDGERGGVVEDEVVEGNMAGSDDSAVMKTEGGEGGAGGGGKLLDGGMMRKLGESGTSELVECCFRRGNLTERYKLFSIPFSCVYSKRSNYASFKK